MTIYLSSETFTVEPVITNIANSSPFSFTSLIPASVISFWAGAWVGAAVGSGVAVGSGAAVGSGVAVGSGAFIPGTFSFKAIFVYHF